MKYRVLKPDLYYPPAEVVQRLQNGEQIALARRGMKRVEAGDVVDDIPEASVPVLLAKGWIEPVRSRKAEVTE